MIQNCEEKSIIEVEKLSVHFGSLVALDSLSFSLASRQIIGLVGPNGAGKTTLIRVLSTMLLPTLGKVAVAGLDVIERASDVRRIIGYRPDFDGLYQDMRVEEYLGFFADAFGLTKEEKIVFLDRSLDLSGLADRRQTFIEELSHGMRVKLSFVRTLAGDPAILILDEPLSGLDPLAREDFLTSLTSLREEGKTILVSSHMLSDLEKVCDRVLFIDKGKLLDKDGGASEQSLTYQITLTSPPEDATVAISKVRGVEKVESLSRKDTYLLEMAPTADPAQVLGQIVRAGIDVLVYTPIGNGLEMRFRRALRGGSK